MFDVMGRLYQIEAEGLPGGNEFEVTRFQQSLVFERGVTNRPPEEVRAIREACPGLASVLNAAGNPVQPPARTIRAVKPGDDRFGAPLVSGSPANRLTAPLASRGGRKVKARVAHITIIPIRRSTLTAAQHLPDANLSAVLLGELLPQPCGELIDHRNGSR
jgi:hypothetical protein